MPSTNYVCVNGQFLPEPEARISIFDRGFLYGDGVFETLRVYGGKLFRLPHHQLRLAAGLRLLRIEPPLSAPEIAAQLQELIARNQIADGIARIYITRGAAAFGLGTPRNAEPTTVVWAQPYVFEAGLAPWRAIYATLRLGTVHPLSDVKAANRLPFILAKLEAEHAGVDEAVLLNGRHHVIECSASNLFAVAHGALHTPPATEGALPGVTRGAVLELARTLGIPTHENWFDREFLDAAEEIFATSSLIEIRPIIELDRRVIGAPTFARRLHEAYRDLVRKEIKGG